MQNQFNVVMLATEKATGIALDTYSNVLRSVYSKPENSKGLNTQHLYIVDNRAVINVGDWYIDNTYSKQMVSRCEKPLKNHKQLYPEDCKIIASTDKSLGLPEIPQTFIEAYVENPNIEIDNVTVYSKNDVSILLKDKVLSQEYNQILFTEQEQEDFKQVVECSRQYCLLKSNEEEQNLFKDMIEMSKSFDKEELQKQQMIEFISLEKQQELWDKWESYSIDIQSAICSKILNHSNSDCYVDMNDLLYLDSIGIREQTAILVAKVKIVSLLTNNYFGECDYATLHEAHVTNVDYNVSTNTYTITLCRPGLLIGKGGEGYDRLCKELNAKIEIIEHKWY